VSAMPDFLRGPSFLQLAALRDVLEGRKKRAAGIGRCGQCGQPWITDAVGRYCPECRHGHELYGRCGVCTAKYRLEFAPHTKCVSCRAQLPLFPR
jgi:hypothetical protein